MRRDVESPPIRSSLGWTSNREDEEVEMRYLLLIYGEEAAREAMPEDAPEAMMKPWNDYTEWLKEKGWYLGGEALEPTSTATTVRSREGEPFTTDGPFAETKEALGGFYLIDCPNLDDAIEAAKRIPSVAFGQPVEVRPIADL
jgi:hypothetical protein